MNRLSRSILTGGILGAAVGIVSLYLRKRQSRIQLMAENANFSGRARRTLRVVRDNALRFGSAVKNSTRMLAHRTS